MKFLQSVTKIRILLPLFLLVMTSLLVLYSFFSLKENGNSLPWEIGGECGMGYHVRNIEQHDEFIRLTCSKGNASQSVEIVPARDCPECILTDSYLVQAVMGNEVDRKFLKNIQLTLMDWEKQWGHIPFVRNTQWIPSESEDSKSFFKLLIDNLFVISNNQDDFWNNIVFFMLGLFLLGMLPKGVVPVFFVRACNYCCKIVDILLLPAIYYFEFWAERLAMKPGYKNRVGFKVPFWNLLLVALISYIYLNILQGFFFSWDVVVDEDSIRDLLMAKDCISGMGCHFAGPPSDFVGKQGALWIHFLVVCQRIGLSIPQIQQLILIYFSLSAAIIFSVIRHLRSLPAALAGTFLFLVLGFYTTDQPALQNSVITPLPFMLLLLSSYWLLIDGSRKVIIITALLAAICVETHLIFLLCLPYVFFLVAYRARNGLPGVVLALSTTFCFWCISSNEALVYNYYDMNANGLLVPFLLANLSAIFLGWCFRKHHTRISQNIHPGFLLLVFTILQLLIISGLLILFSQLGAMYYYFSVMPGLCLLGGMAYEKIRLKRSHLLALYVIMTIFLTANFWFLSNVFSVYMVTQRYGRLIEQHFEVLDKNYLDLFEHVHIGGAAGVEHNIKNSVLVFSQEIPTKLPENGYEGKDYYFQIVDKDSIPKENENVMIIGQYLQQPIVAWSLESWIKREDTNIKIKKYNKYGELVTLENEKSVYENNLRECANSDNFSWACLAYTSLFDLPDMNLKSLISIEFTFPLVAHNNQKRLLCTTPYLSTNLKPWKIVEIKGFDYEGQLPNSSVMVKPKNNRDGEITVALDVELIENMMVQFESSPTILEIPAANSWIYYKAD